MLARPKANILINRDGRACIADFGLLMIIPDRASFMSTISCLEGGTIRWMSPELLDPGSFGSKDGRPTKESDCYALGMVVYEVLGGQAPFAQDKNAIVIQKIMEGERPRRPQGTGAGWFTDALWEMLELCWKPQPHDRPSLKALLQFLGATPPSPQPRPATSTPTTSEDADKGVDDLLVPAVTISGMFSFSSELLIRLRPPRRMTGPPAIVDGDRLPVIHKPLPVLPSPVDQNSNPPLRSTSHRSTITRSTTIIRNILKPSVAATATDSAVPPKAAPLKALPPAKEIPLTLGAGIKSWWEAGTSATEHAEGRLLRYVTICLFRLPQSLIGSPRKLSYYRSEPPHSLSEVSDQPVIAYSSKIVLNGQKRHINTLSITSTSPCDSSPAPAVLLHGYGAGLGFFFKNFSALGEWAASRRSSVYAIDWLGMGRSARVPFVVNAKRDDIPGRVREAEAFFVDSLEEWREKMKLEKMTLVGHALGAYMSVVYALKYPTRVSRLVLLSPVGVLGDPNTPVPSRELTDKPTNESGYVSVDDAQLATKAKVEEIKSEQRNQGRSQGKLGKVFTYLWEEGWSPFEVVRSAMWYRPILVGKYVSRRFPGFTEEEVREMHDYILNITLAKGSGEYCICELLPSLSGVLFTYDRL